MRGIIVLQFVFLFCKSQNSLFQYKEIEFSLIDNSNFLYLNHSNNNHLYTNFIVVDSSYWVKQNDSLWEQFIGFKKIYKNPIDTQNRVRIIKQDSKSVVYWIDHFRDSTLEHKVINKHPAKRDRFTDKHYIEYNVANKPYKLFKPVLEKGVCYYKSIKNPLSKIQVFSINPKDTIVSYYPDRLGMKGNFSDRYHPLIHYEKDTFLNYFGLSIPCYKFVGKSENWSFENCYDKIIIFYEKASLLPILNYIDTYEYNEAKNPTLKQFVKDILVKMQVIYPSKIIK